MLHTYATKHNYSIHARCVPRSVLSRTVLSEYEHRDRNTKQASNYLAMPFKFLFKFLFFAIMYGGQCLLHFQFISVLISAYIGIVIRQWGFYYTG